MWNDVNLHSTPEPNLIVAWEISIRNRVLCVEHKQIKLVVKPRSEANRRSARTCVTERQEFSVRPQFGHRYSVRRYELHIGSVAPHGSRAGAKLQIIAADEARPQFLAT